MSQAKWDYEGDTPPTAERAPEEARHVSYAGQTHHWCRTVVRPL
ncbi:hypothetical protein [Primorskyibacter flagellatus]|nr:hypothetical protein [Primorskyibacter flagellatus]